MIGWGRYIYRPMISKQLIIASRTQELGWGKLPDIALRWISAISLRTFQFFNGYFLWVNPEKIVIIYKSCRLFTFFWNVKGEFPVCLWLADWSIFGKRSKHHLNYLLIRRNWKEKRLNSIYTSANLDIPLWKHDTFTLQ
jgi:hypothetical protein